MTSHYVVLEDRAVIGVEGPEARPFLQGLVSNDIERISGEQTGYGALLTPQGKFLFEFLISERDSALLLETERARVPDLLRRLTMYRLRAKVELTDHRDGFVVAALLGEHVGPSLGLPATPGACRATGDGLVMLDPRLGELGGRALLPPTAIEATLRDLGFSPAERDLYERRRLELGVPDGSRDLTLERATLLESGFEELNGVDFKKGCFVGQELTARMKYRGLVRKRLMPVTFEGPPPAPGTSIRLGPREAGEMRSGVEGIGLAVLRLEHVIAAETGEGPLLADDREIVPALPTWARFLPGVAS